MKSISFPIILAAIALGDRVDWERQASPRLQEEAPRMMAMPFSRREPPLALKHLESPRFQLHHAHWSRNLSHPESGQLATPPLPRSGEPVK
jgi:hypothetical protein